MNSQMKGSAITFTDVFWKVAASWKRMLIFGAAGLLLAGLYVLIAYSGKKAAILPEKAEYDRVMSDYNAEKQFVLEYNSVEESQREEKVSEAVQKWSAALNSEQLDVVNNALNLKKLINENAVYQRDSILMNLDPYNVNTLTMILEFSSEGVGFENLLNLYSTHITSEECIRNLAAKVGWDTETKGLSVYAELFTTTPQYGNQLVVTVQYSDLEGLENIANALMEELGIYRETLIGTVGGHAFSKIEQLTSIRQNTALADMQNSIHNQQITYNTELASLVGTMQAVPEQINLYNSESDKLDGGIGYVLLELPAEPEVKAPQSVRPAITYLLAGCIVGVFLGFLTVYLTMLFSTRIQKTEELQKLYDMPLAGHLFGTSAPGMDSRLANLHRRKEEPKDNETAVQLVASNIGMMCSEKQAKSLMIISSSLAKEDMETIHKLSDVLKGQGIDILHIGNILIEKESMDKLLNADAYVIAETVGKARYRDIETEIALLDNIGKKQLCAFGIECW